MIPSPSSHDIVELQKSLPKKQSHLKEEAKIRFILACIKLYRERLDFGPIDFEHSLFNGREWEIKFMHVQERAPISSLVEQIMSKWYFFNLSKNENVYFYRFINIFRVNMSSDEWQETVNRLSEHPDLILRENILVYLGYREKLDAIDQMLAERSSDARGGAS